MLPQLNQIQQAVHDQTLPAVIAHVRAQPNAAAAVLAEVLNVVAPIVSTDPGQLVPQLLARIPDPCDEALAPLIAELHAWQAPRWLKLRSRSLHYRPSALKQSILLPHEAWVTSSIVINESGSMLALTSSGMVLKQALTGDEPLQTVETHSYRNNNLARCDHPRQVVFLGKDTMLFLWDTDSLHMLGETPITSGTNEPAIAVSPTGSFIVIGARYGGSDDLLVYRLADLRPDQGESIDQPGEPLKPIKTLAPDHLSGHPPGYSALMFSADDAFIVALTVDGTIRIWDWQREQLHATRSVANRSLMKLAAVPTRQQMVVAFADGTLELWDIPTQTVLAQIHAHYPILVNLVVSRDGRTVASSTGEGDVRLWRIDRDQFQPLHDHGLDGHYGHALDDYGEWLVTSGPGSRWCLWDVAQIGASSPRHQLSTGVMSAGWAAWVFRHQPDQLWIQAAHESAARQMGGHQSSIQSVAASADGRWLVVGDQLRQVSLWDMQQQGWVARMLGHDVPYALAISDDAHTLVCVGEQTAVVWEIQTARRRAEFYLYEYATATTVSSSGAVVAVASKDGIIHLWHAATPDLDTTIECFEDTMTSLLITSDEAWLIGGGSQGGVYCWSLDDRDARDPVWQRPLHQAAITALAVDPDHAWLLAGSTDGSVKLTELRADSTPLAFALDAGIASVRFADPAIRCHVLDEDGHLHEFDILIQ
jgi:WD40 repeat protein